MSLNAWPQECGGGRGRRRESPAGAEEAGQGLEWACSRVETMGRGKGGHRWDELPQVEGVKAIGRGHQEQVSSREEERRARAQ